MSDFPSVKKILPRAGRVLPFASVSNTSAICKLRAALVRECRGPQRANLIRDSVLQLLRRPCPNFGQLLDDALAHSKRNKRSYRTDVPRIASLKQWFGSQPAAELTPKEIENVLARAAEKEEWAPSTFNHYRSLMSLAYREVSSNPVRSVPHRREDNNRVRFLSEDEEKKLRKLIEQSGLCIYRNWISRLTPVFARGISTVSPGTW